MTPFLHSRMELVRDDQLKDGDEESDSVDPAPTYDESCRNISFVIATINVLLSFSLTMHFSLYLVLYHHIFRSVRKSVAIIYSSHYTLM